MKKRTITIQGKDVTMAYCAATENGFEDLRKKSAFKIDYQSQGDLMSLALCGIVAAYSYMKEEPPVNADTLLYEITHQELDELIKTIVELSAEWHGITAVVAEDLKEEQQEEGDEKAKN